MIAMTNLIKGIIKRGLKKKRPTIDKRLSQTVRMSLILNAVNLKSDRRNDSRAK
jgi:hypothetical protein